MMALVFVVAFLLGFLNWALEATQVLVSDDEWKDLWKEVDE